ncbi:hypothetical protein GCM10009837_19860 [Streptomyces durmitorensis]
MHPAAAPQAPPVPRTPPLGPAPPTSRRRGGSGGPGGRGTKGGLLDPVQLLKSFPDALRKLHPRALVKKPVLFVVAVGSVLTTLSALAHPSVFAWVISVWLWLTVIFANLAEAVAEGRGKAQAESLRKARKDTVALRLRHWRYGTDLDRAETEAVAATDLRMFDFVLVEAGELIPADGDVVDGVAAVDESAVTGESAPVIRESGGDRTGVTGGTTVLSDRLVVRSPRAPGTPSWTG